MSECYHKFRWPLPLTDDVSYTNIDFTIYEATILRSWIEPYTYTVYWSLRTSKLHDNEAHTNDLLDVFAILCQIEAQDNEQATREAQAPDVPQTEGRHAPSET